MSMMMPLLPLTPCWTHGPPRPRPRGGGWELDAEGGESLDAVEAPVAGAEEEFGCETRKIQMLGEYSRDIVDIRNVTSQAGETG